MDRLPEEILLRIFKLLVDNVEYLLRLGQVSKRFYRVIQDPKLWYISFQQRYPIWGSRIQYASNSTRLIDWKDFYIHLIKQQHSTKDFTFSFVNEEEEESEELHKKRKRVTCSDNEEEDVFDAIYDSYVIEKKRIFHNTSDDIPFWIQDPLVVDIDRITKKGVVATGKHRKNITSNRSEHKILFWEYPTWKLKRTFELNLTPPNLNCQIIGIQSISMPSIDGKTKQTMRFFSLAIGMALVHEFEPDIEDRVDIWKSIFIYRLFDDGSTQCLANIKVNDFFLGREIFLFSGHDDKVKDWMKIVSPNHAVYDDRFTIFMLAIGPIYEPIIGCVQLTKFDIRGQLNILDPSLTPVYWDHTTEQISALPTDHFNHPNHSLSEPIIYNSPTKIIATIKLGSDVSCMIHFKYPSNLNHLICTGSYQDDELSVYDWRFGIKVGTLPWKSNLDTMLQQQQQQQNNENLLDVRPWGLESTLVLPPYWSEHDIIEEEDIDLSKRGFRLIAVGDNRSDNTRDKLEIKVWDISYLLKVTWNPLSQSGKINENCMDLSHKFSWWSRRTSELERLGLYMIEQAVVNNNNNNNNSNRSTTTTPTSVLNNQDLTSNLNNNNNVHNTSNRNTNQHIPIIHLPYSPPKGFQSMLLSHTFDKDEEQEETSRDDEDEIPVKYTAYNVLYTSLFLLTEDGKVTVMDIETGKITGTVQNVAANNNNNSQQVRGIDVNVIGGKEVVVTSKEGLLRGIVN